jgi:protein tyrosine phosphatase (PTP) superfamily phosphohydrolase (DUF442 family)
MSTNTETIPTNMKSEATVGGQTVCGQPTAEEYRKLADHGYTDVINFRMPEEYDRGELPVMPTGIVYHSIPFTGATLSREDVSKTRAVLKSSKGKVLIH